MKKSIFVVFLLLFTHYIFAQDVQISIVKKIKRGQKLTYEFTNMTKSNIFLFNPMEIIVEKKKGKNWVQLETPYCPCGRACPPPPDVQTLTPNEKVTFVWTLEESLCENNEEKKRQVEKGKYRISVWYAVNKSDKIRLMRTIQVK